MQASEKRLRARRSSVPSLRFPAGLRIKRSDEFRQVFEQGQVAADETLVVHAKMIERAEGPRWDASPSTEPKLGKPESSAEEADRLPVAPTRLGLSISKRVGSAPLRNRWKRLIREAFRHVRQDLPQGMLIVVRPRKGAQPDSLAVSKSLVRLWKRLYRKLNQS